MNNRISVATIDSPEFVNLQSSDISPLMSKCEVKVLYVGQNRNRSFITKEVATEMSKTLRGCPIVGYFIENKEDFGDHGDQMIIDGEGIRFNKLTKPYGFIAPDAKIWFKFFEDKDEFGNTCVREYLMAEGYLWTEQYEECKRVLHNNNPQSMELDEKTLKGHWSTDNNTGIEFFIINDAIFSKLCILGDDVEPCFEGASVSAPDVSSTFSKDNEFMTSLLDMVKELKFALNNYKGGDSMQGENTNTAVENQQIENPVENFSAVEDKNSELDTAQNKNTVEEFAKKDEDDKDKEKDKEKKDNSDSNSDDSKDSSDKKDDDDEDKKKKYELLEAEHAELQQKYAALVEENKQLNAYKNAAEESKKDELIASFYMLSDEDKKDVIDNKANYSLEDIENKLSVICVRKNLFAKEAEKTEEKEVATTYNLNSLQTDDAPAWVKAARANANK